MPSPPKSSDGALSHLRILDLASSQSQACARIFADLGADVIKIEPPDGDPGRQIGPFKDDRPGDGRSLGFSYANRGKRSVTLDLEKAEDRRTAMALAREVDVLVEDHMPGHLAGQGLGYEAVRALNPGIVYLSITPFGQTGEFKDHLGGDLVAQATGGIMYANGDDAQRPAAVPYDLISQIACLHGVFGALTALRARRTTGQGQQVDVSRQEVVFYCQGSYLSRYSMQNIISRRERLMPMGGVNAYQTSDGSFVNVAPFMDRHFSRLAQDVMRHPVLSDPEWSKMSVRRNKREEIDRYISEYVATVDRDAFVEEGQRSGVPIIPVLLPQEFVEHPHTKSRRFFQEVWQPGLEQHVIAGPPAILSGTPWVVDGQTARPGEHTRELVEDLAPFDGSEGPAEVAETASTASVAEKGAESTALEGLRVVDFTRAFAGPLATMFLGFFGAEIVKIESKDLDDNRQDGQPNFAELNRGKLSCTIDTRTDEGKALTRRLVEQNGVVVENFRPGVMERLGLSYDELREVRADLIMLSMPGFGNSGPLRGYYSYGQQVMGMTGFTHLWGHPESPINARVKYAFPDYVAAVTGSVCMLAALEHRDETGRGQYIELSQVEALAHLMSLAYVEYTELGRPPEARGNWSATAAPHDVYPCLGYDAWCAIEVRTDDEWRAFVGAIGSPEWTRDERFRTLQDRAENKAELDSLVGEWTASKTPRLAVRVLQAAGVPAGIVATAEDLYNDPHLRQRNMVVSIDHPQFGVIAHAGINVHLSGTPGRADVPAPSKGQDNEYVFAQLLGLDATERTRLDAANVLR